MRIAHIVIAVLLSVVACEAGAEEVWAPKISEEGYIRAKKSTPSSTAAGDDGNMCWAATASNLIEYWQQRYVQQTGFALPEGTPAGSEGSLRNSKVFDAFHDAWGNSAKGIEIGLYWYFSGAVANYVSGDVKADTGGYWKDYCARLGYGSTYDSLRTDVNSYSQGILSSTPVIGDKDAWKLFVEGFGSFVRKALESGSLVGLSMVPESEWGGMPLPFMAQNMMTKTVPY